MKTPLTTLAMIAMCGPAFAQGQLVFSNRTIDGRMDAPVFAVDCRTLLTGSDYLAQLYVGQQVDSLSPVGPVLPFRTGIRAGYITATLVTTPFVPESTVFAQMRAWAAAGGPSYEAAVAAGGKHGQSVIVPVILSSSTTPPRDLLGLQSFCLVPEPPAGALLALGGGLWLLLARRRSP
jgi:hypothetical protein